MSTPHPQLVDPPSSPYVPWALYMSGHLEHERLITTALAQTAELSGKVAELKTTADDINKKITQHTIDEQKTWDGFDKKLDSRGKITIESGTLAKVILPSMAAAATVIYYAKLLLVK